jgi:HNH endonuclease
MPHPIGRRKRNAVWGKSQGRCWYFGVGLIRVEGPQVACAVFHKPTAFMVDHLLAKRDGGTNALTNLVPSCAQCNRLKGRRSLEAFRQRGGYLQEGIPYFSVQQIAYLRRLGLALPDSFPAASPIVFWFEQQGLHP